MRGERPGLHATVLGESSTPPPILLLHGFTGSSEAWGESLLTRLAGDRLVLAVDLPGHGLSGIPEGDDGPDIETVVDQLGECLDRHEIQEADWTGYSMGGRIALAAAVLTPKRIRRLVLESASPGLETAKECALRRSQDKALASRIEERGMEWFVDHWMSLPLFESQRRLPDDVLAAARSRRLRNEPRGLASALRALGTGAQPSFWPDLPLVERPVLVLTGELDAKYVAIAARMEEALPNAERVTVPGVGHTVHLEASDAWLDAVTTFLDARPEDPDQG